MYLNGLAPRGLDFQQLRRVSLGGWMNGSFIDHYERKMIAGSTSFQFSCCLNFLIDFSGESDDTLFKNSEKFWKGDQWIQCQWTKVKIQTDFSRRFK